ncbi:MAG: transporter [Hyphomicrobiaceae bacterium]|nr:transporter [Hyphomicrobiaceae bacterium]
MPNLGVRLSAGAAFLLGALSSTLGQDRSQYTLFNPVPDSQLRELITNRPDITESPFTVDAGHVQFETTLFGYTRSARDADGAVSDSYEFGTTNIRVGLTSNTEVALVWQPYGIVLTRGGLDGTVRRSGIGGLELRGTVNLWGNDTFEKPGSTALGLLPFVVLPTDRNNGVSPEFTESGLLVPFAIKLPQKFELATNVGVTWTREDPATGYHAEYLGSASLAYEWTSKLSTYYEVAGRFHTEDPRGDVVVLSTGVTYQLGKNVQLDAGVVFGVTPAADRINPFTGLSVRF